jgi:putative methyltransferase (TIGR04325 family)
MEAFMNHDVNAQEHAAAELRAYWTKFLSNEKENLFFGDFDSFEAARAAVPSGMHVGYEGAPGAPMMYSPQICTWDYPAIFWLADAFGHGMTSVFDLGGHVGIKYYAFRRLIQYPEALRWMVSDVRSVTAAGEDLARQRQSGHQLRFCHGFDLASGVDILLLSGSLQYLPMRLSEILQALPLKPRRLILNITAVHASRTVYTLNSIGCAICPYRIQFADELLSELRQHGYRRRDVWRNDGKSITIPFVEGGEAAHYLGCCYDDGIAKG